MRELNSSVNECPGTEENDGHELDSKFAKHLRDLETEHIRQEKTIVFTNDILVKLSAFDDNYGGYRKLGEHTMDFWKRSEVKNKFPEVY